MNNSRVLLRIPLGGDAPQEVRLFKFGKNETTQGVFLFDEISAASVMAADSDYGNERSADYEHQALFSPPVEAPASAWYTLTLRDDGLYAVGIRWTERARRMIEAGEYRYISPAFMVDTETNRVMEYINFALTNLPATKNMEALLRADPLANFIADNYSTLIANGLVSGATEKQQSAVKALKDASRLYVDAFNDESAQADLIAEPEGQREPIDTDSVTTTRDLGSLEGADASQTEVDQDEEIDLIMTNDAIKVILNTLGLSDSASASEIQGAFERLAAPSRPETPKQDILEPARVALGLKEADAKAVGTAITTLRVQVEELSSELDETKEKLAQREVALSTLERQAEEHTVEMLLDQAEKAGKLKDEKHGQAIVKALTNSEGRVNVEALGGLIESLPEVVTIKTATLQEAPRAEEVKSSAWADKSWGEMTPTQKLNLYNEDPDAYERKRAEHHKAN